MALILRGVDEIRAHAGKPLGTSSWVIVDQQDTDAFAAVGRDWDWIHCDPERARSGPFGGTIVHGFHLLALLVPLLAEIYRYEDIGIALNYGFDRVRFPSPAPVGSQIRLVAAVGDVVDVSRTGIQTTLECVMECDATAKPVMAASLLVRYYGDPGMA